MGDLLERVLAAEERAEKAEAEVKRLRRLVYIAIGDGDEVLGLSAMSAITRVTAAEELVREVLQGRGGIPVAWAAKAEAQLAAAKIAQSERYEMYLQALVHQPLASEPGRASHTLTDGLSSPRRPGDHALRPARVTSDLSWVAR